MATLVPQNERTPLYKKANSVKLKSERSLDKIICNIRWQNSKVQKISRDSNIAVKISPRHY